jgi:hypothetical protein
VPLRLKAGAAILLVCPGLGAGKALAFRPFDGTDAAVADPGELEIELGPAGLLRAGPRTAVIAPTTVINLGVAKDWEVVLQGEAETVVKPPPVTTNLVENGLFVKRVLREGVLQDKPGPSIATEFGALLPGIGAMTAPARAGPAFSPTAGQG